MGKFLTRKTLIISIILIGIIIILGLLTLSGGENLESRRTPTTDNSQLSSTAPPPTSTQTTTPTDTPPPSATAPPSDTALPNAETLVALSTELAATNEDMTPAPATSASGDDPTITPTFGAGAGDGPEDLEILPTEVALAIRDISGAVIGDGTLRVFAPKRISYPETARVELELRFNNLYITPTPFGQNITVVPVVTATFQPGQPTPTEAIPIHETSGQLMYELMGASLFCSAQSFSGCDTSADPLRARFIDSTGTNWSWILSPQEMINGLQDLEVRLWTLRQSGDGTQRPNFVWDYEFRIEINPTGSTALPDDEGGGILAYLLILAGVVLAGGLTLGGIRYWQRRPYRKAQLFISYRRADSQGSAGRIYDRLSETFGHTTIFRDVDAIEFGENFRYAIEEAIATSTVFIAVIGRQWLTLTDKTGQRRIDNPEDFVRQEIALALQKGKRIIPALVDGAVMPTAEDLPVELRELALRNAINIRNDSFDDDVKRLVRYLTHDTEK